MRRSSGFGAGGGNGPPKNGGGTGAPGGPPRNGGGGGGPEPRNGGGGGGGGGPEPRNGAGGGGGGGPEPRNGAGGGGGGGTEARNGADLFFNSELRIETILIRSKKRAKNTYSSSNCTNALQNRMQNDF